MRHKLRLLSSWGTAKAEIRQLPINEIRSTGCKTRTLNVRDRAPDVFRSKPQWAHGRRCVPTRSGSPTDGDLAGPSAAPARNARSPFAVTLVSGRCQSYARAMDGTKFGIETEYALLRPDGRFADFTNTDYSEVRRLLDPLPDYRHPELRVGDAGIRVKNWYVEGDERFDESGRSTGLAFKGVEIRTPVCATIEAAMLSLHELRAMLASTLEAQRWSLVSIGYNPCAASYEPVYTPWEKAFHASHVENAFPEVSTLSYGPDFNFSCSADSPEAVVERLRRLTYYSPYIVPLSFSSPFVGGRALERLLVPNVQANRPSPRSARASVRRARSSAGEKGRPSVAAPADRVQGLRHGRRRPTAGRALLPDRGCSGRRRSRTAGMRGSARRAAAPEGCSHWVRRQCGASRGGEDRGSRHKRIAVGRLPRRSSAPRSNARNAPDARTRMRRFRAHGIVLRTCVGAAASFPTNAVHWHVRSNLSCEGTPLNRGSAFQAPSQRGRGARLHTPPAGRAEWHEPPHAPLDRSEPWYR